MLSILSECSRTYTSFSVRTMRTVVGVVERGVVVRLQSAKGLHQTP